MTTTTRTTNDGLGTIAARETMGAAADYCLTHKLTVVDYDAATNMLRDAAKGILDEAMSDAKKAIEAGMGGFAAATYRLSFRHAGIKAAQSWLATGIAK